MGVKGEGSGGKGGGKWVERGRELGIGYPPVHPLLLHTGQCKRTGGCYNELVVAFFITGGGVKGKKSIPVDFIIYL